MDGSRYIDALQEKSLVMSMGATSIPDCGPDLALPKMLEQSQVSWVGENQEISDTSPEFGRVEFKLKSPTAIATYSRNLLIQSAGVVALENVIKSDLVRVVAQAIDRACIFGNPATNPNEPLGIFNNPECQEIAPSAPTGDDFDYELLVEMERQLFQKNAYGDGSALGYLTNANIRAKAKTKTENNSNISQWIWQAGESLEFGRMNGYRAGCSSAMPPALEPRKT
ncbi:phage major capsid protein [Synechocystis salina]|uniref:phage major capsid protein n=1 Tax=Synechocystis salina TaxID=945780 RepID=UPI001D1349E3|nr:phage major capsid protein [Synechocystis salina]